MNPGNVFTIIEYQYTDAGNYKKFGEILVDGVFSKKEEIELTNCLIDNEFFIPDLVNIPNLAILLEEEFGISYDDHEWHRIVKIYGAKKPENNSEIFLWEGNTKKLLSSFKKAHQNNWEAREAL